MPKPLNLEMTDVITEALLHPPLPDQVDLLTLHGDGARPGPTDPMSAALRLLTSTVREIELVRRYALARIDWNDPGIGNLPRLAVGQPAKGPLSTPAVWLLYMLLLTGPVVDPAVDRFIRRLLRAAVGAQDRFGQSAPRWLKRSLAAHGCISGGIHRHLATAGDGDGTEPPRAAEDGAAAIAGFEPHLATALFGPMAMERLPRHEATDARFWEYCEAVAFWPEEKLNARTVQQHYLNFPYPWWYVSPQLVERHALADLDPDLGTVAVDRHWRLRGATKPQNVLIVGCGAGRELLYWRDRFASARLTALDLSRRSLNIAGRKLSETRPKANPPILIQAEAIEWLESTDQVFDLIISSGVVHHLPDPARLIQAMRKRLALSGSALISIYSSPRSALYRWVAEYGIPGGDLAALTKWRAEMLDRTTGHFGDVPPGQLAPVARRLKDHGDWYDLYGLVDFCWHPVQHLIPLGDWVAMAKAAGFRVDAVTVLPVLDPANPPASLGKIIERVEDAPEAFTDLFGFWLSPV